MPLTAHRPLDRIEAQAEFVVSGKFLIDYGRFSCP